MSLFHLFLVAIIQGLTEFLPVSSSGHLVLLPHLAGFKDQGLAIDVAVHVGTLFAVMIFFRADMPMIWRGCLDLLRMRMQTRDGRFALALGIATIPVVVAGLVLHVTGASDALRSVAVIGWSMLIFGLVLYWADQRGSTAKTGNDWTLRNALIMGLWQAVALIPGTSRSGITITGARVLGYDRREAARLAMLMSIPTIAASGLVLGMDVATEADPGVIRDAALAAALAFGAALLALRLMMHFLERVSYTPYVIYRVVLGAILLIYAYG